MAHFAATNDFTEALGEIDYLLQSAAANERNVAAYNVLNKAAVLLLAAKLEAFIEQVLEEFCFIISEKKLPCERIPLRIRLNATRALLNEECLAGLDRAEEAKTVPSLESLARLWHHGSAPINISVDCKFAFGKHGEREFRRLFQRIGIDDVFESCKVADEVESYDQLNAQQNTTVTSDVNALIGYRNFIIHNDGTPNITHIQLGRYRRRVSLFVQAIDDYIAQLINAIK